MTGASRYHFWCPVRRLPLLLAALFGGLACEGNSRHWKSDVVGSEETVPSWSLRDTADFRVSGFEVDGDSVFLGPFVPGTFTADGHILVAITGRQYEVVLVDSLGTGIARYGRTGSGPGEFERISAVMLNGDTVTAWDWLNQRVAVIGGTDFTGQRTLGVPRSHAYVGHTLDGAFVVTPRTRELTSRVFDDAIEVGVSRPYEVVSWTGEQRTTLLGPPEPPPVSIDMITEDGADAGVFGLSAACTPKTFHYVVGNRIVVADSRRGLLSSLGQSGATTTLYQSRYRDTVRADLVMRVEEVLASWEERVGRPISRTSKRAVLDRIGRVGDALPTVWSAMVRDVQGGFWLQRASCSAYWLSDSATTWEVVDREGTLKATVQLPDELSVVSVSGDRVLVQSTGEFNVPYISVYGVRMSSKFGGLDGSTGGVREMGR